MIADMRIPFDNFALKTVVREISALLPARIQDIRQPTHSELVFELFGSGGAFLLRISWDSQLSRTYIATRKPANAATPFQFCALLRSRLGSGTVALVEQLNEDRVMAMTIQTESDDYMLVAELMGNRSNALLIDGRGTVVAIANQSSASLRSRNVFPGKPYDLPPNSGGGLGSKVYRELITTNGGVLPVGNPVFVPGSGAYPVPLTALGLEGESHQSFSRCLELATVDEFRRMERESIISQLTSQLNRAVSSSEAAISEIERVLSDASRAKGLQNKAQLLLAYGPSLVAGATSIDAYDFDGEPITLTLDEGKTYAETAERLFHQAKKSKEREPLLRTNLERIRVELAEAKGLVEQMDAAESIQDLRALEERCSKAKWWKRSHQQQIEKSEERGGKKIRELVGPGGSRILYGENAEANDYLTTKMAKPDDLWFHVRGHSSAHVVIPTHRQPERVTQVDILFAAQVAVMHSNQKHASHVPVDYSLKKYVRKARGSAPGAATYVNEKTLFIDAPH